LIKNDASVRVGAS